MDGLSAPTDRYRQRIESRLAQVLLARQDVPDRLLAAMEYSVLGNGKRVRPLLAYASGVLGDVAIEKVDAIACAVELVHAYSLVHDDLPAMDDDDLRRGRPTTHRAFDEALAILAGDALQALAFELLCMDPLLAHEPARQARVVARLARACGPAGMVGGQALDMEAEGREIDEPALEAIHRRKTGALISAAIMMPCELSSLSTAQAQLLERFADDIGLVFQIRDDLLEVEQDTATLGKHSGSDLANGKSTYPTILGVAGARAREEAMYTRAMSALNELGPRADALREISSFILTRSH
jgi:geranylgeranyl diphosphate synthase type II